MVEQEEEEEPERKRESVFFSLSVLNGEREKKREKKVQNLQPGARVCFGIKESVIPVLQTTLNCVKLGIMQEEETKQQKKTPSYIRNPIESSTSPNFFISIINLFFRYFQSGLPSRLEENNRREKKNPPYLSLVF